MTKLTNAQLQHWNTVLSSSEVSEDIMDKGVQAKLTYRLFEPAPTPEELISHMLYQAGGYHSEKEYWG